MLDICFLFLAGFYLWHRSWFTGFSFLLCWIFTGLIGRSLPHTKNLTPEQLSKREAIEFDDGKLSADDGLGLQWAIVRTAPMVGLATFALAWHAGWRWYWVILATIAVALTFPLLMNMIYFLPFARKTRQRVQ